MCSISRSNSHEKLKLWKKKSECKIHKPLLYEEVHTLYIDALDIEMTRENRENTSSKVHKSKNNLITLL